MENSDAFNHALSDAFGPCGAVKRIEMPLHNLRTIADNENHSQLIKDFLEATGDVDGEAIVVLTEGNVALLIDEQGNSLAFA